MVGLLSDLCKTGAECRVSFYKTCILPFFIQIETWADCEQLMSNALRDEKAPMLYRLFRKVIWWRYKRNGPRSDREIRQDYNEHNCSIILTNVFKVNTPTLEEKEFPIAYTIQVYKGAALLERLLSAIYMPHNIYCIHIDIKSSEMFRRAVIKMTKCLPNVFVTRRAVNVIYYHISILQAQLNCMHDLLQSRIQWKYLINLVGQDYPLYDNKGLLQSLKGLYGINNIESIMMPENQKCRYTYSYEFKKYFGSEHSAYIYHPAEPKLKLPPHNISIFKGSTLVSLTRGFCEYIQNESLPNDFLSWLTDTIAPEELFYSSLQQIKGVPGGQKGNQSEWIMRALHWHSKEKRVECHGRWMRSICVVDFPDLAWIFGKNNRGKLFVQKIPFDFDQRFLDCVDLAKNERSCNTFIYNN